MDITDKFNEILGVSEYSYGKPIEERNGYRIWARPFIPAVDNPILVALYLAWPVDDLGCKNRYFVSMVGNSRGAYEYNEGETFDLRDCSIDHAFISHHTDEQVRAVCNEALESLRTLLDNLT